MTAPLPYLSLEGTAREALSFYRAVFGGEVEIHTYADFGRTDGPAESVAHGMLHGPVELAASDAAAGEPTVAVHGMLFALLGAADPAVMREWFERLGADGSDIDPLQLRPWGDHDGQVTDRYGLRWLIGFKA